MARQNGVGGPDIAAFPTDATWNHELPAAVTTNSFQSDLPRGSNGAGYEHLKRCFAASPEARSAKCVPKGAEADNQANGELQMGFNIGQSIIHPSHGAGKIVAFQEKELVKGFQRYYVIEFIHNRLTVHVPVRRIDQTGVRPVMPVALIAGVFDTLETHPLDLPDEFRVRRNAIEKQIHSGYPNQVAAAVRDLAWREDSKYLTEADKEALFEARTLLITELALALEQSWELTERSVDDAIARAIRNRLEAEARALEEEERISTDWPFPVAMPAEMSEAAD